MTRNRSSRGRRVRGRHRPQEGVAPEQLDDTAPATTQDTAAEPDPGPRRQPGPNGAEGRATDDARSGRPASRGGQRPREGAGGDSASSRGGQGRNRRRTQRRNQVTVVSGEVLKPNAPVRGVREPLATHSLEEISAEGEPVFGCPMLTRTRLSLPLRGGNPVPRCSLGWAVHSEAEAAYCLETPDLVQCWKAHPERLEEIRARLGEAVTAAD